MTQSPTLMAALALASINVAVFPCKARAKRPATPHGCLDATTDPDRITRWWHAEPNLNVAAATGQRSGIIVIDIDGPAAAAELRRLESKHGDLPDTATVFTVRGEHLWFEYPGATAVPSSISQLAPGVDIKADGGFVLAPPSIHPTARSTDGARARRRSPPRLTG